MAAFIADRRGAIAVIFALASAVLLAIIGISVDYGSAYRAKSKMQQAADAAAIALVRYDGGEDAPTVAARIYKSNSDLGKVVDAMTQVGAGGVVTSEVSAVNDVQTSFMGLFGFKSLNVEVHSSAEAPMGVKQVRFRADAGSGWWEKTVRLMVDRPDGSVEELVNVHYDVTNDKPPKSKGITATPTGWVDLGDYTHAYLEFKIGPKKFEFNKYCSGCPTTLRSDDPDTSDRFVIDGKKIAKGVTLDLFDWTKCSGESKQSWEDGGGGEPDIFYTIESICGKSSHVTARLTK